MCNMARVFRYSGRFRKCHRGAPVAIQYSWPLRRLKKWLHTESILGAEGHSKSALIAVMTPMLLWPASLVAKPIDLGRIRVIDGDTIRIDKAEPDHRLIGFNAPETRRAKSEAERQLGDLATARLRQIVRAIGTTADAPEHIPSIDGISPRAAAAAS